MSVNSKLTTLANSIRNKTGKTDTLTLDAMASDLNAIADNDSSDLIVSGATISVPAGNYKVTASKSVATVSRASTTMSTTADDTNDKLTITASNNQGTGYVTGANKTASTTVTLTTSGATATMSDGSKSVSKSVTTASRAATTITTTADDTNDKLTITASNNQSTGYVTGSNQTATKTITLTASGASVTASDGTNSVSKSVTTASRASTTISSSADDTNDKLTFTASNNQATGYVTGSNQTATKTVTLTASGSSVTASDGTNSVSKSVATATQATPSVSIDANGKITATATQTAGYVAAGTKTGTKQLTVQAAQTITPSTSDKTIASGRYLTGTQTIKGDANLVSNNIAKGVSIFGVTGSHSGGVELNFEVVGGTTKPSSPKANTIWVNTSTAVNGWGFGTLEDRPASPSSGMVWIKTTIDASTRFNALKENYIFLCPTVGYQYVSGSWRDVVVKIYQDGSWKDFIKYLYNAGDQFTETTGGWQGKTGANGICTFEVDYIMLDMKNVVGGRTAVIYTYQKINLNDVNTIYVDLEPLVDYSGVRIGLTSSVPSESPTYYGNYITSKVAEKLGRHTIGLSVSSYTGTYYVVADTYASIAKIHRIWME